MNGAAEHNETIGMGGLPIHGRVQDPYIAFAVFDVTSG